jgi:hypothetical protein
MSSRKSGIMTCLVPKKEKARGLKEERGKGHEMVGLTQGCMLS